MLFQYIVNKEFDDTKCEKQIPRCHGNDILTMVLFSIIALSAKCQMLFDVCSSQASRYRPQRTACNNINPLNAATGEPRVT